MSRQALANKYRPKRFSDVVGQDIIKSILVNQLETKTFKNCLLFTGGAGTGKTTSGRIFANEVNDFKGSVIELDAASNNSVDDIRRLVDESRYKPLDAPYKVFIIDECHALSSNAWQAFLKCLEEPIPTSIFILCTTDPQKIPATILSRVQRYNFQRIPHDLIVSRLKYIIDSENDELGNVYTYDLDSLSCIARIADGGMRDAITLLDKVLGFSTNLTVESVTKVLCTADYGTMFDLTDNVLNMNKAETIKIVESVYMDGVDLKQFMKSYSNFVLDLCKYDLLRGFDYIQIPPTYKYRLDSYSEDDYPFFTQLLNEMIKLNDSIKWETTPKPLIESTFILLCSEA